VLADVISLGLIAFASSPRVIFSRWSLLRDRPSLDLRAGGPGRWGPVFRTLASVVADDVRLLRADGYERIRRPLAFFLVSGPPHDPDWNQVFRETLTYDRKTGMGMKEYPVFFRFASEGAAPPARRLRAWSIPSGRRDGPGHAMAQTFAGLWFRACTRFSVISESLSGVPLSVSFSRIAVFGGA
jgi:hypothetical protein